MAPESVLDRKQKERKKKRIVAEQIDRTIRNGCGSIIVQFQMDSETNNHAKAH